MTTERKFGAPPWSQPNPTTQEMIDRYVSSDPIPFAAPSTAVYDSAGNARAVKKITVYDSTGAAREVKKGTVYDSAGNARVFFSGGSVPAPPITPNDRPGANLQFLSESWGSGNVCGWNLGNPEAPNRINPAVPVAPNSAAAPKNLYVIEHDKGDQTLDIVYAWDNVSPVAGSNFQALNIYDVTAGRVIYTRLTGESTFTTGSSAIQWRFTGSPQFVDDQLYQLFFNATYKSTGFTPGTLGAKTGYLRRLGVGSMGALNFRADGIIDEWSTDGTTAKFVLQIQNNWLPWQGNMAWLAYIETTGQSAVPTKRCQDATSFRTFVDTDGLTYAEWLWPETNKFVNGAGLTFNAT
jgi:hypothetical protein